jgi:MFS family permease
MNKITFKAIGIFLLAASFYWYEMALQVAPSIMSYAIMHSLDLNAAGFGTLSACYFYAFAPMQIPAGLLYDRYGPRLLMTLALSICTIGTLIFALSNSFMMMAFGRFMMGFGSAFSFIGILLLIARWFPARYFALMAGITQGISSLGAICGEFPLAKLAVTLGWRPALIILSLIGGLLAILMGCFIRDYPISVSPLLHHPIPSVKQTTQQLKSVWRHPQTTWVGLYAFGIWAPIAVFGALWSVPFLCVRYAINAVTASKAVMMIWIGIGAGSILLGWIANQINNRRWPLIASALMGVITVSTLLYYPLPWSDIYILLFLFGFAAGGQTLSFDVIKQHHLPENMGTASGINNMAVLMGGALFQPLVGYLLVTHWDHVTYQGVPVYSLSAFQDALFILPLCFTLSLIMSLFFIKDRK